MPPCPRLSRPPLPRPAPAPRHRRPIRVQSSRLRSPLRHCPFTSSRLFRRQATSGRRDTGPGTITITTGCPASGCRRRNRVLLWTPAYWAFVGGAYLFHQGYWGPHVGFYGGVNYGFGYNGLGYEGGRWEGGRFAYNTTVNNFGGVHVTNVYSQNVTVLPGVSRVSYNGGPGGVALKPTPEQERLTAEQHVRPTQLQVTQARTASMEATQFNSANKGKPAVAATERPGELKGPGVVPAKAAGTAEVQPAQAPNAALTKESLGPAKSRR